MMTDLEMIQRKIKPILEDYGVEYAGVFGSTARGEETSQSDVDLLVRFERPIDLFAQVDFCDELRSVLGKPVDVVTEKSINPLMRSLIFADLKTVYEK